MTRHTLKCWPEFFEALSSGDKTFEVRQGHDRHYKRGDELLLREWKPLARAYTGREMRMLVTYVMLAGPFLPGDLWVMSVKRIVACCCRCCGLDPKDCQCCSFCLGSDNCSKCCTCA